MGNALFEAILHCVSTYTATRLILQLFLTAYSFLILLILQFWISYTLFMLL